MNPRPGDGRCAVGSTAWTWVRTLAPVVVLSILTCWVSAVAERPNFVVIVADDLGRGDLGCFGGTRIRTPSIDRVAAEGVRLDQFYTPAPTCSPARAALLTGRHPLRTGITRVFVPKELQGFPATELTLAEHLREAGYSTACIGKWHLGGRKRYRPQRHGFDEFYGVLYSNNMVWWKRLMWPRLELFEGDRIVESPADQSLLTRRYTHRAIQFLEQAGEQPFFLYVAYTMPHIPVSASPEFTGRSGGGRYADAVEELDASVGHLMARLTELDLDLKTIVFLTSDNGPWTGDQSMEGGSTGGLRGFKGTVWEGGLRVPFIGWAPGRFPAGELSDAAATLMDVFPTVSSLAGVELPQDLTFDGTDISPVLRRDAALAARDLFFSNSHQVLAIRSGPWKLHLRERAPNKNGEPRQNRQLEAPLLYDLEADPSEKTDVAADHPRIVDRLRVGAEEFESAAEPTIRLRSVRRAIAHGLLTPKL